MAGEKGGNDEEHSHLGRIGAPYKQKREDFCAKWPQKKKRSLHLKKHVGTKARGRETDQCKNRRGHPT